MSQIKSLPIGISLKTPKNLNNDYLPSACLKNFYQAVRNCFLVVDSTAAAGAGAKLLPGGPAILTGGSSSRRKLPEAQSSSRRNSR